MAVLFPKIYSFKYLCVGGINANASVVNNINMQKIMRIRDIFFLILFLLFIGRF